MASPTGLEPVTPNLEGSCSILMSYGLCGQILRAERDQSLRELYVSGPICRLQMPTSKLFLEP